MKKPTHLTFSAIAAMAENRVIGKNNQLPWRLPADLKHFKTLTSGHVVLMGRKTYASIGRPLPNRTNIILTRDVNFSAPGCLVATSIENAIAQLPPHSQEIFIIGGAEIYQQLLPQTDRLYLTIVHENIDGDAYFPVLNQQEWQEISRETFAADAENAYSYSFLEWQRIK